MDALKTTELSPEVRDEIDERKRFYMVNIGEMLRPRDHERAKDLTDEQYFRTVSEFGEAVLNGNIRVEGNPSVQKTIDAYWKGMAKLAGLS